MKIEKTLDEILIELFGNKNKKLSIKEFKEVVCRLNDIVFFNFNEDLIDDHRLEYIGEGKAYRNILKLLEHLEENNNEMY